MKDIERRSLLRAMTASPAVALLASAGARAQAPGAPGGTPVPPLAPPAALPPELSHPISVVVSEQVGAVPQPAFFTAAQFATLRAVAAALMPAMGGFPGALEAEAPEFIDFYVGRSPEKPVARAELRNWYRAGLDDLEAQARRRFGRAFAALSPQEIDVIIRPMFVTIGSGRQSISVFRRLPFMNEVRNDVRTATMNSPQWAAAMLTAKQRPIAGVYWKRVDPTVVERD